MPSKIISKRRLFSAACEMAYLYKHPLISMQVTHTYHSEHTAWLLDAKCLHYLEHIHNAFCLATLSGIDE